MSVRRRAVLAGALLGGLGGLGGSPLAGCSPGAPDGLGPVRIAAGEPGGFYRAFAGLLAAELAVPCTVTETAGSLANLTLLRAGTAGLALVLGDSAHAVRAGTAPGQAALDVRALGRVYENYLQVAVRADGPVATVADLAGRAVSVGATGSGASLTGRRVLEVAGIRVAERHLGLADAVTALGRGAVDALVWSGGVPTPSLAALQARTGIRLLPLGGLLAALRYRHGDVYDSVAVPAGVYGSAVDVATIGVANLLLCRPDLPDGLAARVVRTLVTRADRLVPAEALGTQFLDLRTLIDTGEVPLHPGAAAEYRRLHG